MGAQLGTGGAGTLTITGAGSKYEHSSSNGLFIGRNGTIVVNIQNGGVFESISAPGPAVMGDTSSSSANSINLSGTNSRLSLHSFFVAGSNLAAAGSASGVGNSVVNVDSGTFFQITSGIAAGTGLKVWDRGIINITGGTVEVAAGKNFELVDSSVAASQPGRGTLRGVGTVQRYDPAGTASFTTVLNTSGNIRPGDVSATPATGLLTLNNAHLNHAAGGFLFLDVDTMTAFDAIRVVDTASVATVATATLNGTLDYTVAGSFTPSVGFLDFVLAEDVIYAPAADDLPGILAGLTLPPLLGYNYGVATVGAGDYGGQYTGYEALRLEFFLIPEPASAALLALGGLLLAPRRTRRLSA